MSHKGVNRLLCAALVDIDFRSSLLEDPSQAYHAGFNGNYFEFTKAELEMLQNIKASRIEDFALQVHLWLEGHEIPASSLDDLSHLKNNHQPGYDWTPIRSGNLPISVRSMQSAGVR